MHLTVILSVISITLASSSALTPPCDDYVQLSKQRYFIDKSDILRVICQFQNPYEFLPAPRRFGKTANLQMIRTFFDFELDAEGRPKNYKDTTAYAIFNRLDIHQHDEIFQKHIAQHPVLYFSAKFDVTSITNQTQIDDTLVTKFREIFKRFEVAIDKLPPPQGEFALSKFETSFLQKFRNGTVNRVEVSYTLFRLCNILYKYYQRKVIILIDDYDFPIYKAILQHDLITQQESPVRYFYFALNGMLRKTCKADRVDKNYAIMTGLSGRIEYGAENGRESFFLDDHAFAPYYGFSEEELKVLLDTYKCNADEENSFKKYYKGYLSRAKGAYYYCPYSVTNYLESKPSEGTPGQIKGYWTEANKMTLLKQALQSETFRKKLQELVDTPEATVSVTSYVKALPGLDNFVRTILWKKSTFKGVHQFDDVSLFRHLVECGYLCYAKDPDTYIIPNEEVRVALKDLIANTKIIPQQHPTTAGSSSSPSS